MATATLRPEPLPADIRLMNATAAVLAAVAVVGLGAAALGWVARQPVFAVSAIHIDGEVTRNSVSTIRANAMPRLAGNFFTLDLAKSKSAFEAVPWVREAVVRRIWPNRLSVRLEEHRPAALWRSAADADEATDKLVNTHGEVFEANLGDVEDDALPTLQGPEGSAAQMLAMLGRLSPLFAPLEAHIDTLVMSGRGSWSAELDNGAEVEIGRGSDDELVARTQRFVATVTQVTSRYGRPLVYADLRHAEGYAVRLKGISTTLIGGDKPAKK